MRFLAAALLCAAAAGAFGSASAATWHVPSQCPTIQAGIDSAAYGDTVLVACGTYYEHDIFSTKDGVCLRSETGKPDCVTIDALGMGRVFHLLGVGNFGIASIEGFTVTGGIAPGSGLDELGGGMYCDRSPVRIRRCVFLENSAWYRGGGVYCDQSGAAFTDCVFQNNSASLGGGAFLRSSSATLVRCEFLGNGEGTSSGGGLIFLDSPSPSLTTCVFSQNHAGNSGALECDNSSPILTSCRFSNNYASSNAAIYLIRLSSPTLVNCTLADNDGSTTGGIRCREGCFPVVQNSVIAFSPSGAGVVCDANAGISLTCCDVFGNAGGDWVGSIADQYGVNGNISEDPLFCDPDNGNFYLQCGSPCAPFTAPNPECDLIGAWPVGCGGTATEGATWSSLKALYR